jgi:hypothetical protein
LYALNPVTGAVVWERMEIRANLHQRDPHSLIGNAVNRILTTDTSGQTVYLGETMQYNAATGDTLAAAPCARMWGGLCGFLEDISRPPYDWEKFQRRHWAYTYQNNVSQWHSFARGSGLAINGDGRTAVGFTHEPRQIFRAQTSAWSDTVTDTLARMKAILWAGDQVYIAVHPDPANIATGEIWVLSANDGSAQGSIPLGAAPRFDGMAAADDRLYVSTQDGRILCLEQGPVSVAGNRVVPPASGAVDSHEPTVVPFPPVRTLGSRPESVLALGSAPAVRSAHQPAERATAPAGREDISQIACPVPRQDQVCAVTPAALDSGTQTGPPETMVRCSGEQPHRKRDTRWHSGLPCLRVTGVSASSSDGTNLAANTIDRNLCTRWGTREGREQWLTYDLGSERQVAAATVVCYSSTPGPSDMSVEVSTDGRKFSTVDRGAVDGRGTCSTLRSFLPSRARYVRIALRTEDPRSCPSVYEVGIHGPQ